jgi:hypothetical protein
MDNNERLCLNGSGQLATSNNSNCSSANTSDGTISGVTSLNMNSGGAGGDITGAGATSAISNFASISGGTLIATTSGVTVKDGGVTVEKGAVKVVGASPFDTTTITGGTVQSAFVDTSRIENVGNTVLGFDATKTLTVNATSTFNAPVTFNGNANVNGTLTAPDIKGGGAGTISGFASVSATQGNFTDIFAASGNFTNVNTKNVTGDGTGTISGFTSVSAGTGSFTTVTATTGDITTVNATDVNTKNVTGDGTGTISGFASVSAGTGSFTTVNATTGNITTVNSTNINNSGKISTGTLETTGLAKLNSLEVTNGADIKGNASVGGSLTVAKGATVSESLTATAGSDINMGGNVVHGVAAPIVGTDAANKQYVDDGLAKAFKAIDRNTQGIAIAMAMAGLALPEGKNFALGANMGFFDDKQAIAIQAAIRVSPNVTITGGFGTGVQDMNATGGRVGLQAAW